MSIRMLYLPFRDYGDDGSFVGTVKRYKSKGHPIVTHGTWGKPLKKLTPDDVLIIMGHGGNGAESRGQISVRQKSLFGKASYKSKTFNDLAEQLEKDGLPKNHKLIKSLTCFGGGETIYDIDNNRAFGYDLEYFAQLLAKALGKRGYKNIMVGGYPGTVGSTTGQKMVFAKIINDSQNLVDVDSDGEYGLPTKGRIIWFNSQGKEV